MPTKLSKDIHFVKLTLLGNYPGKLISVLFYLSWQVGSTGRRGQPLDMELAQVQLAGN